MLSRLFEALNCGLPPGTESLILRIKRNEPGITAEKLKIEFVFKYCSCSYSVMLMCYFTVLSAQAPYVFIILHWSVSLSERFHSPDDGEDFVLVLGARKKNCGAYFTLEFPVTL